MQLHDARSIPVANTTISLSPCWSPEWDAAGESRPSPLLGNDTAECVQVTTAPPLATATAYKLVVPVGARTNRLSGPLSAPLTVDLTGLQPFRFAFLSGQEVYAVRYTRVGLQLRLGLSANSTVEALGAAIKVQRVATLDGPLGDTADGSAANPAVDVSKVSAPRVGATNASSSSLSTAACTQGIECLKLDASGRRRRLQTAPKMPPASAASTTDALATYRGKAGTDLPFNITRLGPGVVQLTIPLEPLWVVSVAVNASDAVRDAFDQPLQASTGLFATAVLDGFLVQPDTQPRPPHVVSTSNGPRALVLLDASEDAWDGTWPVLMRRWQYAAKSWDQGGTVREVSAWSVPVRAESQRQALLGHLQQGNGGIYGKVGVFLVFSCSAW